MPFANGVFTRLFNGTNNWTGDAETGIKILAVKHDQHDKDIGDALSNTICRDGQSTIIDDISWNGHKITDLFTASSPAPTDAVNANYVNTLPGWSTSKNISGADLNGRLNFTNPTGVNGITWTAAGGISWVARSAKASETSNRLVMNQNAAPSTTSNDGDVFVIDDAGRINSSGVLSSNASYDGAGWRTISPGTGTIVTYTNGAFSVLSNDVATITNNYAAMTTLRSYFSANNSSGSTNVYLDKSASAKASTIWGRMGVANRWQMDLGNASAETGVDRVGSNFVLASYNNAGGGVFNEIVIERSTHKVTFGGEVIAANLTTTDALMRVGPGTAGSAFTMERPVNDGSFLIYGGQSGNGAYLQLFGASHSANGSDIILGVGGIPRYLYDFSAALHVWKNNTNVNVMVLDSTGDLAIDGTLSFANNLVSTTTQSLLATTGAGTVYLRPNGAGSTVGQVTIDNTGDMTLGTVSVVATGGVYAGKGFRGKAGSAAAGYGSYFQNFNWNGSTLAAYADANIIGNLNYTVSDYRIKKDVTPLGSMWDKVKALKPISYTQRAFQVWTEDDTPRLGFLAHELRESIDEGAVLGDKDGPDVQFINPMAVIAALTKALQEAMTRIEALEAAA